MVVAFLKQRAQGLVIDLAGAQSGDLVEAFDFVEAFCKTPATTMSNHVSSVASICGLPGGLCLIWRSSLPSMFLVKRANGRWSGGSMSISSTVSPRA